LTSGARPSPIWPRRERAACIAQTLIKAPNLEDWRDWVVHVEDRLGDEVLAMPFASVLGQAN
jgi:hypothetical protein